MKIKQLLFRYPLIWNTRAIPMLSFLLGMNILYFFFGYASVPNRTYIFESRYYDSFLSEVSVYLVATLVLFIAVVIWLFQYLRNNAFKSFYPVNLKYLYKETLIVITVFFMVSFVYVSYLIGRDLKEKHLVKNLKEDVIEDVYNMAKCFYPSQISYFEKQNCCDSIKAQKIGQTSEYKTPCYGNETSYTEYDYATEATPVPAEPLELYDSSNNKKIIPLEYSYLYYCDRDTANTLFKGTYSDNAKRWLIGHNKDSIEWLFDEYNTQCRILGINSSLNSKALASLPFQDSLFSIEINSSDDNMNAYGVSNIYEFEYAPSKIRGIREEPFVSNDQLLVLLFVSLGLSIVLLSFRFTRFKPWIVATLGTGIVALIFIIIGNTTDSEELVQVIYILFIISCGLIASAQIKNRRNKLSSGVLLVWFTLGIGACVHLIFNLIYEFTGETRACINGYLEVIRKAHPIHHWILDNWTTINVISLVIIVLVLFGFTIPKMYQWQANPSE